MCSNDACYTCAGSVVLWTWAFASANRFVLPDNTKKDLVVPGPLTSATAGTSYVLTVRAQLAVGASDRLYHRCWVFVPFLMHQVLPSYHARATLWCCALR